MTPWLMLNSMPGFTKRPEELIQRRSKENEKSLREKYIDERHPRVQGDAFIQYVHNSSRTKRSRTVLRNNEIKSKHQAS